VTPSLYLEVAACTALKSRTETRANASLVQTGLGASHTAAVSALSAMARFLHLWLNDMRDWFEDTRTVLLPE
jgi:hypothetical protein